MRKFWGFYDNGTYKVGCNGQTMYLHDDKNHELAKFKDITYAYRGAFIPRSNIFVLRSTEGRMAVYDCDERRLLFKFRFSDVGYSQDDGFCFSPDGKYFLNIERIGSSTRTRLSIYETQTFSPVRRLFENDVQLVLSNIEYNPNNYEYSVLFFMRGIDGVYSQGYVGVFEKDCIIKMQSLSPQAYRFIESYKSLQLSGFTEKSIEWSGLHYAGYSNEEILELRNMNFDLSSFPQIAEEIVK